MALAARRARRAQSLRQPLLPFHVGRSIASARGPARGTPVRRDPPADAPAAQRAPHAMSHATRLAASAPKLAHIRQRCAARTVCCAPARAGRVRALPRLDP